MIRSYEPSTYDIAVVKCMTLYDTCLLPPCTTVRRAAQKANLMPKKVGIKIASIFFIGLIKPIIRKALTCVYWANFFSSGKIFQKFPVKKKLEVYTQVTMQANHHICGRYQ